MKRVVWTRTAINDLKRIRAYFDEVAPELAQEQMDRIILSARWLLDYPKAGSVVGMGRWRRWRARVTAISRPRKTAGRLAVVRPLVPNKSALSLSHS